MQQMDKKDRPYSVTPYNKEWSKKFEREKKIISNIFGNKALNIEHIGSTAVEGMWAKPQIDILVIVKNLSMVNDVIDQMEFKNYKYQKKFDQYNERYFVRDAPSGERLISIHVIQQGNPKELSHIYLREYLKNHPQEKTLYSQIKRETYESGANRAEYPERKTMVLNRLIKQAKKWGEENHIDDLLKLS